MLISIRARYAVQLISRQIRVMAAVDEVIVQRVIVIDRFGWGACIRGGGGDVGEEFAIIGRQGELMELGRWEETNAGGDSRKVGLDFGGEGEGWVLRGGGRRRADG